MWVQRWASTQVLPSTTDSEVKVEPSNKSMGVVEIPHISKMGVGSRAAEVRLGSCWGRESKLLSTGKSKEADCCEQSHLGTCRKTSKLPAVYRAKFSITTPGLMWGWGRGAVVPTMWQIQVELKEGSFEDRWILPCYLIIVFLTCI